MTGDLPREPIPPTADAALRRAATTRLPADAAARAATLLPLLSACLERLEGRASDWVERSCATKRIAPGDPAVAEEIAGGPLATARGIACWIRALSAIAAGRLPRVAGRVQRRGPLRVVPALPALRFDSLLFTGYRCDVLVAGDGPLQEVPQARRGAALVLGAGNVTSIPPTDLLSKVCRDGVPGIVKLHPLHEPLHEVLSDVFAPLADAGCSFVLGDGTVGARLALDERVTDVHLTGSLATFEALRDADVRRTARARLTAELGNVTPVIVVPGVWRARELGAQVENVAAMLVQNGSFNCVAAKVLVTARGWPQREEFVVRLRARLAAIPRRHAWHPGAAARFARFGRHAPDDAQRLPWTLVRDFDPGTDARPMREEAFAPLLWEVPLDGEEPAAFLRRAVVFCNDELAGDLAAGVLAPAAELRCVEFAVDELRYGVVGVNAWPALAFAWMCAPWGAAPGNTAIAPGSGIGSVHDTLCLHAPHKTVVRGPVVPRPTPLWWPSHRAPEPVATAMAALTTRPSLHRLVRVVAAQLLGR